MQTVTSAQGVLSNEFIVPLAHHGDLQVVNGALIEASIELFQGVVFSALIHVHDTGLEHVTNAGSALALQDQICGLLRPVNEIGAATIAAKTHATKGVSRVVSLPLGVVVAIEEPVNEDLRNGEDGEDAKELDQALLEHKVVLNAGTIREERIVRLGLLGGLLGLICFGAFQIDVSLVGFQHLVVHLHKLVYFLTFVTDLILLRQIQVHGSGQVFAGALINLVHQGPELDRVHAALRLLQFLRL